MMGATLKLPRGFHGQSVRIPGIEAMVCCKNKTTNVVGRKSVFC